MRHLLQSLLARDKDSYKYNFGHVLVLGGSPGLTGAVYLASQAALKIGAGLVTLGCPQYCAPIMEIKTTEVMTLSLPQTQDNTISTKAEKLIADFISRRKVSVVALGPGISLNSQTQELSRSMIKDCPQDLIVDADGIKSLKGHLDILKKRKSKNLVLTPHLGEFSYITGLPVSEIKRHKEKIARDFSLKYDVILVLKGYQTLVVHKNNVYKNITGNSGLSKAGTGDVLTGFISGIIAQRKLSVFDSCKLAVYLHGLAADILKKEKTVLCIMAGDLIDALPEAIART